MATNKVHFTCLLQEYWHSLLQKTGNQRAGAMNLAMNLLQWDLRNDVGEFLSERI